MKIWDNFFYLINKIHLLENFFLLKDNSKIIFIFASKIFYCMSNVNLLFILIYNLRIIGNILQNMTFRTCIIKLLIPLR